MASKAFNRGYWLGMGALPVHFGVCLTEKTFKAALKDLGLVDGPIAEKALTQWVNPGGGTCWQFERESGSPLIIITVDDAAARKMDVCQIAGIAAHECMHAWQFILSELQEKVAGREMEAYHVQHMVQFTVDCLMSKRKGKQ